MMLNLLMVKLLGVCSQNFLRIIFSWYYSFHNLFRNFVFKEHFSAELSQLSRLFSQNVIENFLQTFELFVSRTFIKTYLRKPFEYAPWPKNTCKTQTLQLILLHRLQQRKKVLCNWNLVYSRPNTKGKNL